MKGYQEVQYIWYNDDMQLLADWIEPDVSRKHQLKKSNYISFIVPSTLLPLIPSIDIRPHNVSAKAGQIEHGVAV